jgi:hypothetical protein
MLVNAAGHKSDRTTKTKDPPDTYEAGDYWNRNLRPGKSTMIVLIA